MPTDFFYGVSSTGFLVCAVFFLKFWRRTGERLLLIFAVAFALLAVNQALVAIVGETWIYLLRLAGYLVIIAGIVTVNIAPRRP